MATSPSRHSHSEPPLDVVRSPVRTVTGSAVRDECLRVVSYEDGQVREWQGIGDLAQALERHATVWIDMAAPSPEDVGAIGNLLGLHPLIAEDILEGNQRAKIEVTDQLCHIVMFALDYQGEM